MALYEYKCTGSCDEITTEQRSINEPDPGYFCKSCNSALERVYSNFGVILNGSGFYSTDNRK
jgi:putative FmdB family regulatory protein